MTKDDLALLSDDSIPESVRAALATSLGAGPATEAQHALEREKVTLEARRLRWNTPLVAALAGLITLSATFVFDRITAEDTTQHTITLEQVRQELNENNAQLLQELEKDKALTEAEISARAEERAFQYEIVKSELTDAGKSNAERAAVLLFLVRAGVLSTLNRQELEEMAQRQIENPDASIIPRLTASTVLPGVVGPDDAKPVADYPADHPVRRLAGSVGLLGVERDGNVTTTCTAFLIAANQIATADYCIPGTGELSFSLSQGSNTSIHRVRLEPSRVPSSQDQFVRLEISPPAPDRHAPLEFGATPAEGTQLGAIYHRGSGSQLAIWGGEACRLFSQDEAGLHHSCDTGGGTAGAPIFDIFTNRVVGVHYRREEGGGFALRTVGP